MYGTSSYGTAVYGSPNYRLYPRTAFVTESLTITDVLQKSLRTTVAETLTIAETITKSLRTSIAETLTLTERTRLLVEGNDVTFWRRVDRNTNGSWTRVDKLH